MEEVRIWANGVRLVLLSLRSNPLCPSVQGKVNTNGWFWWGFFWFCARMGGFLVQLVCTEKHGFFSTPSSFFSSHVPRSRLHVALWGGEAFLDTWQGLSMPARELERLVAAGG